MNNLEMPPFPAFGASGPQVCASVCFYLALVDELPFEQVRVLSEHVKGCPDCSLEFQRLQQTTRLLASMPESLPSARVDQAIHAFLRAQHSGQTAPVRRTASSNKPIPLHTPRPSTRTPQSTPESSHFGPRLRALALVAALLLALGLGGFFTRGFFLTGNSATAFALPKNLSWNAYVLHSIQTMRDKHGQSYQVEVYQDLGTNQMHIESTMEGKFDVVVVMDQQNNMLGEDMMHHVAQEGNDVEPWTVDGSIFELAQLRQNLQNQHASYLGQSTFNLQPVYQIRAESGQVLLLDMQYLPVNVLNASSGTSTGTPIYSTFALVPVAQVDDSMWNMKVPSNFRMGQLPSLS